MRRISLVGLRVLLGALLLAAPAGCSVAAPQTSRKQTAPAPSPSPSPSDAIDRRTSEPYKSDLSIFEDPNRAQNLQVERVMDILGVKAGSGVADIGAGSGWFTVRAAREKLSNVRAVLGREEDPLLPDASVDAVLLLKTYHEVAQPVALLRHVRRAMRAGARLGVIDRNGKGDDHGLDADVVIKEAGRAGFKLVEQYDFVKPDGMDYFLVFQASD